MSTRGAIENNSSLHIKSFPQLHGSDWKRFNLNNNLEDIVFPHCGEFLAGKPCCIRPCRWVGWSPSVCNSASVYTTLGNFQRFDLILMWCIILHHNSNWSRPLTCASVASKVKGNSHSVLRCVDDFSRLVDVRGFLKRSDVFRSNLQCVISYNFHSSMYFPPRSTLFFGEIWSTLCRCKHLPDVHG